MNSELSGIESYDWREAAAHTVPQEERQNSLYLNLGPYTIGTLSSNLWANATSPICLEAVGSVGTYLTDSFDGVLMAAPSTQIHLLIDQSGVAGPNLLSPSATAKKLKEISGLTDSQVAALFPVARETFQRWRTGTAPIGQESRGRLNSLFTMIRDLAVRVDSVDEWLFSIDEAGENRPTPYELLRARQYTRVWGLVTQESKSGASSELPVALAFDHSPDVDESDFSDWDD